LSNPIPETIVDALIADALDFIPEPFGDLQNYLKIAKAGEIKNPRERRLAQELHSVDTGIDDISELADPLKLIPGVGPFIGAGFDAAAQIAEILFPANVIVFLKSNPKINGPPPIPLPPPLKIPLPPGLPVPPWMQQRK